MLAAEQTYCLEKYALRLNPNLPQSLRAEGRESVWLQMGYKAFNHKTNSFQWPWFLNHCCKLVLKCYSETLAKNT